MDDLETSASTREIIKDKPVSYTHLPESLTDTI